MRRNSSSALPTIPESGSRQVLLVAAADSPVPEWASVDGKSFELRRAGSLAAATTRLAAERPDVVVLDASLAATEPRELPRLRQALGHSGLLLHAASYTPEIPELMERLGGSACLLPAAAPAPVQAELVWLSAERARLAASLANRVAELEQRTRELEKSRSHFRDVIERNADAIVVVDRKGVIRFVNGVAAELFRSPREELVGTDFGFPVVLGETTELDLLHPGQTRVVEMRVVESEWEAETAYIASLRDITERKRAEEAARTLIREQAARAAAEAAARRFRFLAEASTLLSQTLHFPTTLSTLARLCASAVADWAVIYVVDEVGSVRRLEVAHRDPAKAEAVRAIREYPIEADGPHPVLEVLRTRSPLLAADIGEAELAGTAEDERHLELIRELGIASFMLVPLVARDRVLGALGLVSANPECRFTEDDLAEASDLALRAALAVDNARLYHEAQDANQAKSHLLAVISHDLRTPLNAIMGHAQLLEMGIPDKLSAAGSERVERIRSSAMHLLFLIDELLSFARLEGGHEEIRIEKVAAQQVVHEAVAVAEPLALQRGLCLSVEMPADPIVLRTDPDRLRQILLNLVGNAVKYTEHGEVRLELEDRADGTVAFAVHDTGIGIRQEHLERIFDPFWQVDSGQRSRNGGTGLGLSVVRGLVQLLGGKISVESEVGRGSTFTVLLPRAEEER